MIKLFADGADLRSIRELEVLNTVSGYTTNPTLIRQAGVTDYLAFAESLAAEVPQKPLSVEVITDSFADMVRQAEVLSSLGENIYVKIPVVNTKGETAAPVIKELTEIGVKLNVTAVMTEEQGRGVLDVITDSTPVIISVFAGRIADTGREPCDLIANLARAKDGMANCELLWASTREIFNIVQAENSGCEIITVTNSILKKLPLLGKDLTDFTIETVEMFYQDALRSKFLL